MRFTISENFAEQTITEPYTLRGVRTVPGEGGVNLPPKCGKATPPYSTVLCASGAKSFSGRRIVRLPLADAGQQPCDFGVRA